MEDKFLKQFIAEYELLYSVQNMMRRRMCDIFAQRIVVDQRKRIHDADYWIETKRIKRANEGHRKYKRQIDHVWIDLQATEVELYKR